MAVEVEIDLQTVVDLLDPIAHIDPTHGAPNAINVDQDQEITLATVPVQVEEARLTSNRERRVATPKTILPKIMM